MFTNKQEKYSIRKGRGWRSASSVLIAAVTIGTSVMPAVTNIASPMIVFADDASYEREEAYNMILTKSKSGESVFAINAPEWANVALVSYKDSSTGKTMKG